MDGATASRSRGRRGSCLLRGRRWSVFGSLELLRETESREVRVPQQPEPFRCGVRRAERRRCCWSRQPPFSARTAGLLAEPGSLWPEAGTAAVRIWCFITDKAGFMSLGPLWGHSGESKGRIVVVRAGQTACNPGGGGESAAMGAGSRGGPEKFWRNAVEGRGLNRSP